MFYNKKEIEKKIKSNIENFSDVEIFNLIKDSILYNDSTALDLLLENNCFVYTINDELSVFEWCVYRQNMSAFEKLNAYKNLQNFKNDCSLNIAVMLNLPIKIIKYIEENCYNIDVSDHDGMTSLNWALQTKNNQVLKYLLTKGANPNLVFNNCQDNLFFAVADSNLEAVKLLLKYGAEVNPQDNSVPLTMALHHNNFIIADYLISHGADVNLTDEDNRTALFDMAVTSDFAKCEYLIKNGANETIEDKYGVTPEMLFKNKALREFLYKDLHCGLYEEWDEEEAELDLCNNINKLKKQSEDGSMIDTNSDSE